MYTIVCAATRSTGAETTEEAPLLSPSLSQQPLPAPIHRQTTQPFVKIRDGGDGGGRKRGGGGVAEKEILNVVFGREAKQAASTCSASVAYGGMACARIVAVPSWTQQQHRHHHQQQQQQQQHQASEQSTNLQNVAPSQLATRERWLKLKDDGFGTA